ncbi:hypothetical protein Hanom_Chr07g00657091 [Helianthus anomalus]
MTQLDPDRKKLKYNDRQMTLEISNLCEKNYRSVIDSYFHFFYLFYFLIIKL